MILGMGALSTPARAAELKQLLDQVATNREARAVADEAVKQGGHAAWMMTGFLVESGASLILDAVKRLQRAESAVPLDDQPIASAAWRELRNAIEGVVTYVWAQERAFPEGHSAREELSTFADGFVQSLKDSLGTIAGGARDIVGGALAAANPITSPVLIGAGIVGGLLLVNHLWPNLLRGGGR